MCKHAHSEYKIPLCVIVYIDFQLGCDLSLHRRIEKFANGSEAVARHSCVCKGCKNQPPSSRIQADFNWNPDLNLKDATEPDTVLQNMHADAKTALEKVMENETLVEVMAQ